MKNLYNLYIALQKSYRQHNLQKRPDSTQNYSSSRRSPFDCMLSIMKYLNRLNMRSLSPSSTQNYKTNKRQRFSYMLNSLKYQNKLSMKSLSPDSIPNYRSSRHLRFSCRYCNQLFENKSDKRWNLPNSNRCCRKCTHLKFSCTLSIKNLGLNIISNLQNLRDSILVYKLCTQRRLPPSNQDLIPLYIK